MTRQGMTNTFYLHWMMEASSEKKLGQIFADRTRIILSYFITFLETAIKGRVGEILTRINILSLRPSNSSQFYAFFRLKFKCHVRLNFHFILYSIVTPLQNHH